MTADFEIQKNRKAFIYTSAICAVLLLLFFFIRWKNVPPPEPVIQDLMEINLGNNLDGFGEEQPLIKGDRGVAKPEEVKETPAPAQPEKVTPEDDGDGAEINKPVPSNKKSTKAPVPVPDKPVKKPKLTYNSPTGKETGNNATEDNGYKYQGKTKKGKGDNGVPEGHPDSYGTKPGGAIGGPKVIKGNRNITNFPSFSSDLKRATVFAEIKVSPSGSGTYIRTVKPTSDYSSSYTNEIRRFLSSIKFNPSNDESVVTVKFNFVEN